MLSLKRTEIYITLIEQILSMSKKTEGIDQLCIIARY